MSTIKFIQLDPNGLCNQKCWFCPVAYLGNPESKINQMSIRVLEKVFIEITNKRREGLITADFLYFSHYNEVLLYKHFDRLLQFMRDFGWTGYFLTNGTTLSKKRVDQLMEYSDVNAGMCINSPSYTEELFEKTTGHKPRMLKMLIKNVRYAIDAGLNPGMVINGIDERSNIVKGSEFPEELEGANAREYARAKELFPEIHIQDQPYLIDRAGYIDHIIKNKYPEGKVVGCHGNRETEWLHINALGEVFVCCNDYNMDYVFGNLVTQTLDEIWGSPRHKEVINLAYEGICTSCTSAKMI